MYGAAGEHGNEEQNRISVYCGHCYQVSRSHGITGFFCPKKTQSRRLHSFSHWANMSEHLPSARPVVSSPSGDRTLQSEGPGIAEDFEGPAPRVSQSPQGNGCQLEMHKGEGGKLVPSCSACESLNPAPWPQPSAVPTMWSSGPSKGTWLLFSHQLFAK